MLSFRLLSFTTAAILLLLAGTSANKTVTVTIKLTESGCPAVTPAILSAFVANADGSNPVTRAQASALACHLQPLLDRSASTKTAAGKAAQVRLSSLYQAWAKAFHPMSSQVMSAVAQKNWQANLQVVVVINAKQGSTSWAGLNAYSALSPADFAATVLMAGNARVGAAAKKSSRGLRAFFEDTAPEEPAATTAPGAILAADVNWVAARKARWVSRPVAFQATCASSWALAATAALESHLLIYGGINTTAQLSAQHIMDCAARMFNYTAATCKGGSLADAFQFAAKAGVTTDSAYRYRSTYGGKDAEALSFQKKCDRPLTGTAAKAGVARIVGTPAYTLVSPATKEGLMQALATQPAAALVAVDASFQHYAGGIWTLSTCAGAPKQAMLIVGYNTTQAGQEYFLAKNSMSAGWGEAGYMRLEMSNAGGCGMYSSAYQPADVKIVSSTKATTNSTNTATSSNTTASAGH